MTFSSSAKSGVFLVVCLVKLDVNYENCPPPAIARATRSSRSSSIATSIVAIARARSRRANLDHA